MMKIDFSTRFLSYCVHFCNSAKDPSPTRYQRQIFQPFRYYLRIHDLFEKRIVQELHSTDSRTKIKELLPCCISPTVKFLCEFYVTIDFFQNLFSASYHWKIVLQLCCHRQFSFFLQIFKNGIAFRTETSECSYEHIDLR